MERIEYHVSKNNFKDMDSLESSLSQFDKSGWRLIKTTRGNEKDYCVLYFEKE